MSHGHLTFPALPILCNIPAHLAPKIPLAFPELLTAMQYLCRFLSMTAKHLQAVCMPTGLHAKSLASGCSYLTTSHCSPSTLSAQQHPGAHLGSPNSSSCVSVSSYFWLLDPSNEGSYVKPDFTVSINPNHRPWCMEVWEGRQLTRHIIEARPLQMHKRQRWT